MSKWTSDSAILGIILIMLGALFLSEDFTGYDVGDFFQDWWPLIIVLVGIMKLRNPSQREKISGVIIIGIGFICLLASLHIVRWDSIWSLWPIILIFVGVKLLLGRKSVGRYSRSDTSGDTVDIFSIFSSSDRKATSSEFRGGNMTSIFGSARLSLTDANLDAGTHTLWVMTIFGECEVVLPEGWDIELTGTPIFSTLSDKRPSKKGKVDGQPRLMIKATAIFGRVEIR